MGFLLGFLFIAPFVFLYFLIIKGVDRYEPEPFWLLTVAFFWGAMGSTLFAIIGNEVGQAALGAALGAGNPMVDASTATFVAPVVEESTKGFGLLLLWAASAFWLKELDGPLDGAIYGGVIGLGFTLTEDILYTSSALAQGGGAAFGFTFVLRTIFGGLGHATFTAMTGIGIGVAIESRNPLLKLIAPIGGWMSGVGLHFLHNFLVTFYGGAGLFMKFAVFWSFDVAFFIVLFVLVWRDRTIVLRQLAGEVGQLLHPAEYKLTTSSNMFIPFWNWSKLRVSARGYGLARKKQLALIDLAFVKARRERGEGGSILDGREQKLRYEVAVANQQGVFIGAR